MSAAMKEDKLKALVSELAKDIKTEKDLGALTQQLVKLTVETALNAELDEHLGYGKHDPADKNVYIEYDDNVCRLWNSRLLATRIDVLD